MMFGRGSKVGTIRILSKWVSDVKEIELKGFELLRWHCVILRSVQNRHSNQWDCWLVGRTSRLAGS